jgi:hypothetical protein
MAWKLRMRSALPLTVEVVSAARDRADEVTELWPVEDRDRVYQMLGLTR